MKRKWIFLMMVLNLLILLGIAASYAHAVNPGESIETSLQRVLEHFANPPAAFRPAPLYTWNGDMQEEEIARQLDEFKAGGFGGVFVHPRPGLITPYLSQRWLELWRFTAEEAAKRGMVTYIYDENSYPSGFAGGHVPEQIPGSGQLSLHRQEISRRQLHELELHSNTIALYRITNSGSGGYIRIPIPNIAAGQTVPANELALKPGDYILYTEHAPSPSSWYGGKTYVDLMRKDVSKRFLDITFDAYDSVLSGMYGKQVLASFTDEPQTAGAWSTGIPKAFQEKWGYDILDHLPSIHNAVGNWRKIRHDYSAVILELFMNHFAKPYVQECEERGIAFTGHVWEHGWPHLNHNPDIMSFYRWQHWPGIDCLMNDYSEGTNAQFGNYRANKELDSIANQLGRVRRLCETYGAGGWDLTLEDVKRIGDHLMAGGVNLLNPHLSYYTIMGARKRDHPQSFSYHQPFWEAFQIPMDYFSRLSWVLAAGTSNTPVLIIEPTVTMWMYNWSKEQEEQLNRLGSAFQSFITELGAKQTAFDLGSEPVMAEIAQIQNGRIQVGKSVYEAVILPPGLECLESSTVELLSRFATEGGTIVSYAGVPPYVDAVPSDAMQSVKTIAGGRWIDEPLSAEQLAQRWGNGGIRIQADAPQDGRVYHFARDLDDGTFLFLINTSLHHGSNGNAQVKGEYIERWNAVTGEVESVPFTTNPDGTVSCTFHLYPAGSALYAIYNRKPDHTGNPPQTWQHKPEAMTPASPIRIHAQEPNVLMLDYADLVFNGDMQSGLYFYEAQTAIFNAYGFDRNPWDNSVQFEDEIIKRDHFPPESGFELRYSLMMEGFDTMPALELVVEQGEFYTVAVNGHAAKPKAGAWRIDRAFRVYSIAPEWLHNGENIITTTAKPFSLFMETEPIYIYGGFNLKPAAKGFMMTPAVPLEPGAWNTQGAPFYSSAVLYEQTYHIAENDDSQHYIELQEWKGTAARVDVNGQKAGYILWQPYKLDISSVLRPGENTVAVTVFGSLKNLLGPHHAGPLRGRAWPNMFQQHPKEGQPPGNQYDTIGYGLIEPFLVY